MTTHSLPAGCLSSPAALCLSHNALFPPHSRVHKRRHKTAGWGGGSWKPGTRTDVCVLWCHRLQAMDTFCFGPQVPLKPQVLRVVHLWAAGSRFSKWVAEGALLGCWRLAWDVSIGGGNETREPEGLSGHGEPSELPGDKVSVSPGMQPKMQMLDPALIGSHQVGRAEAPWAQTQAPSVGVRGAPRSSRRNASQGIPEGQGPGPGEGRLGGLAPGLAAGELLAVHRSQLRLPPFPS